MYSVKEVALKLRISPATVYALCGDGKIRHERYGRGRGTIRIPEEALEEYRKTSTTVGASVPEPNPTPLPTTLPAPRLKHVRVKS